METRMAILLELNDAMSVALQQCRRRRSSGASTDHEHVAIERALC